MYNKASPTTIQQMFASIAQNYDLANTTFTFGLHKKWNNALVKKIGKQELLLDLCAGTGEIAFGFLKKNLSSKAILLDFCPEMLKIAEKKGGKWEGRFSILQADAQKIPLVKESVSAVTISYGIRNVKEPEKCFKEVFRVLHPQGKFAILELTRPKSKILNFFHRLYLKLFLPFLGKLTAKNADAYRYLVQSVQNFASPDVLEKQLKSAGFQNIEKFPLLGGTATIVTAFKP